MSERSTGNRMLADPGSNGHPPRGKGLTADQYAERFQGSARVLWTVAAGVLGGRSQAEDVLQEACVIGLGKLEQFDPRTSFTAWMGQVVRNVALNHARKEHRQATAAVDPQLMGELLDGRTGGRRPLPTGPDHGLPIDARGKLLPDAGAFDDALLRALRGLDPNARACLLLRTVLGVEYREIAQILGLPEGTAMSHVHRSRQALRKRLALRHELERGA